MATKNGFAQRGRMIRRPSGITLIEILAVIAIVGVLTGLLLPAVQQARESSRRVTCTNKLRQLGVGLANHESARGHFPVGAESRQWDQQPTFPYQFFRWSVLAHLSPFYEEQEILRGLDLSVPLYTGFSPTDIAPQNRPIVSRTIPLFLCPSDRYVPVSATFGPTNYASCTGSGAAGGTPFEADGLFFINSRIRPRQVTDGLSRTVAFSESILGDGPQATNNRAFADPVTAYAFTFFVPLSETRCLRATDWNFTDLRGFSWANGEYRTTAYNHYRSPNASSIDCIGVEMSSADKATQYAGYGWRAARSRHPGGVNVVMADGSWQFVGDAVDPAVWKALATRAGGEAAGL